MLQTIKRLFKHSQLLKSVVAFILYSYLKLVYLTTRWVYIFPSAASEDVWNKMGSIVAVAWHDRLAILPKSVIHKNKQFHILVSPHSDGIIIASVLKLFGFHIIPGSTNKDSILAVKSIMHVLKSGENIAITPDGPRGPRHKINSNIISIAKKCNATILPISCITTNAFFLKSWDKLIFPFPFGKIYVYVGAPILPDISITEDELENVLNTLSSKDLV